MLGLFGCFFSAGLLFAPFVGLFLWLVRGLVFCLFGDDHLLFAAPMGVVGLASGLAVGTHLEVVLLALFELLAGELLRGNDLGLGVFHRLAGGIANLIALAGGLAPLGLDFVARRLDRGDGGLFGHLELELEGIGHVLRSKETISVDPQIVSTLFDV